MALEALVQFLVIVVGAAGGLTVVEAARRHVVGAGLERQLRRGAVREHPPARLDPARAAPRPEPRTDAPSRVLQPHA